MLQRRQNFRWSLLVGIFVLPGLVSAVDSYRVATYNLDNYFLQSTESRSKKSAASLEMLHQTIAAAKPDILAMQEMSGEQALIHLQSELRQRGLDLRHREIITGWDTNIHVAVLSKFPITARRPHSRENYLLNGRRLTVSRGFLEIDLLINPDYQLTLLCAHLKSKRPIPTADQADMRLEEAKLLRRKVDSRLRLDPDANVIVVGDFNDNQNSPPIRALIGRGKSKLIDTRPAERNGDSNVPEHRGYAPRSIAWTYHYAVEDSFSRVDYIMASPGLGREWLQKETHVVTIPDWGVASDHRMIVATFDARDR